MKATLCFKQEGLTTFCLTLLGKYAEVWVWPDGIEICGLGDLWIE